jgi:hypothetical protein
VASGSLILFVQTLISLSDLGQSQTTTSPFSKSSYLTACNAEKTKLGYTILKQNSIRYLSYPPTAYGFSDNVIPYSLLFAQTTGLSYGSPEDTDRQRKTGYSSSNEGHRIYECDALAHDETPTRLSYGLQHAFIRFEKNTDTPRVCNSTSDFSEPRRYVLFMCECGYVLERGLSSTARGVNMFRCIDPVYEKSTWLVQSVTNFQRYVFPTCPRGYYTLHSTVPGGVSTCILCGIGEYSKPEQETVVAVTTCSRAGCPADLYYPIHSYVSPPACERCRHYLSDNQHCTIASYSTAGCKTAASGDYTNVLPCGTLLYGDADHLSFSANEIRGQSSGGSPLCGDLAQALCADGTNTPFSPVIIDCGAGCNTASGCRTPKCVPCNTFSREGYYLHSCANGIADVRHCTDTISISEFETPSTMWFWGYKDCGTPRTFDSYIGPGEMVECSSFSARGPPGKFLQSCNVYGLKYASCIDQGTQCDSNSFQVLCGANEYDVGTKLGITSRQLVPFTDNSHGGTCISCDEWAPYRCQTPGDVLWECGMDKTELVDPATWYGRASGTCRSCEQEPVESCSSATRTLINSGNSAFYRAGCGTKNQKDDGSTLECKLCDDSVCGVGQELILCGGSSPGICTTCSLPSYVGENIEFLDGYSDPCSWKCRQGFTGHDCKTRCISETTNPCPVGETFHECVPPYQGYCKFNPLGWPEYAIDAENVIFGLHTNADFNNFVFTDLETGMESVNSVVVGNSTQKTDYECPLINQQLACGGGACPTLQSSTFITDGNGDASKAFDGGTSGRWHDFQCAATLGESTPWWRADLVVVRDVVSLTIFPRTGEPLFASRLGGFRVLLSESSNKATASACYVHPGSSVTGQTSVPCVGRGRYVWIDVPRFTQLELCEVQIFINDVDTSFPGCSLQGTEAIVSRNMIPYPDRWSVGNGILTVSKCSQNSVPTETRHQLHPHPCDTSKGHAFAILGSTTTSTSSIFKRVRLQTNVEKPAVHVFWARAYCNTVTLVTLSIRRGQPQPVSESFVLYPTKWTLVSISELMTWTFPSSDQKIEYAFTKNNTCPLALDEFQMFPLLNTRFVPSGTVLATDLSTTKSLENNSVAYKRYHAPANIISVEIEIHRLYPNSAIYIEQADIFTVADPPSPGTWNTEILRSSELPANLKSVTLQTIEFYSQSPIVSSHHVTFIGATARFYDQTETCNFRVRVENAAVTIKETMTLYSPYKQWKCNNRSVRRGHTCVPCSGNIYVCENQISYRIASCNYLGHIVKTTCEQCFLPVSNAEFVPSVLGAECSWTCMQDYTLELSASGSLSCVSCDKTLDCGTGYYKRACPRSQVITSDSVAISQSMQSVCVPCSNRARNARIGADVAFYTGQSLTYNDDNCPYACPSNYYLSYGNCLKCSDITCVGQILQQCTAVSDAMCVPCGAPEGTNRMIDPAAPPCSSQCIPNHFPCTPCEDSSITKTSLRNSDYVTDITQEVLVNPDNSQRTYSSIHRNHPENSQGQLNSSSAWLSGTTKVGSYMDIDLLSTTEVIGVVTQGSASSYGHVTYFTVNVSRDGSIWEGITSLTSGTSVFSGNSDTTTTVTNYFDRALETRYVRIMPQVWAGTSTPSMRSGVLTRITVAVDTQSKNLTVPTSPISVGIPLNIFYSYRTWTNGKFSFFYGTLPSGYDGLLVNPLLEIRFSADSSFLRANIQINVSLSYDNGFTDTISLETFFSGDGTRTTHDLTTVPYTATPISSYLGINMNFMEFQTGVNRFTIESPTFQHLGERFPYFHVLGLSVTTYDYSGGLNDPCISCIKSAGEDCWNCENVIQTVPGNASIVTGLTPSGYECRLKCNDGFRGNSAYASGPNVSQFYCFPCPDIDCPIGMYQDNCSSCANCILPPQSNGLAYFVGPGGEFDSTSDGGADAMSCPYSCASGAYGTFINSVLNCFACSDITCDADEWHRNCSEYDDSSCETCSSLCPPGMNKTLNCTTYSDIQCSSCGNELPLDATWVKECEWDCIRQGLSSTEFIFNPDTFECMVCQPECPVGQYNVSCSSENAWTGCRSCQLPQGEVVPLTAGFHRYGCQWRCADGYEFYTSGEKQSCVRSAVPIIIPDCDNTLHCLPGFHPTLDSIQNTCECSACPNTRPTGTMWINECDWACVRPKVRNGNKCVYLSVRGEAVIVKENTTDEGSVVVWDQSEIEFTTPEAIGIVVPLLLGVLLTLGCVFWPHFRRRKRVA